MHAIRSSDQRKGTYATNVTSTYLLSLRVSVSLLKYRLEFPIERLKTLRPSAMKTALICLVAGFGLAHVTSFVAARTGTPQFDSPSFVAREDASRTSGTAIVATAYTGTGTGTGTTPTAFSQYEVQTPQTVTVAGISAGTDASPAQALAAQGVEQVVAATSTLTPVHPDIASNVARGVSQMDEAMKTAPVAMARMSESVAKNGIIAALAYDDPAVKAQTNKLSAQIGDSLRNFAEAIGKDMQRSVRESGIQAQSVSAR